MIATGPAETRHEYFKTVQQETIVLTSKQATTGVASLFGDVRNERQTGQHLASGRAEIPLRLHYVFVVPSPSIEPLQSILTILVYEMSAQIGICGLTGEHGRMWTLEELPVNVMPCHVLRSPSAHKPKGRVACALNRPSSTLQPLFCILSFSSTNTSTSQEEHEKERQKKHTRDTKTKSSRIETSPGPVSFVHTWQSQGFLQLPEPSQVSALIPGPSLANRDVVCISGVHVRGGRPNESQGGQDNNKRRALIGWGLSGNSTSGKCINKIGLPSEEHRLREGGRWEEQVLPSSRHMKVFEAAFPRTITASEPPNVMDGTNLAVQRGLVLASELVAVKRAFLSTARYSENVVLSAFPDPRHSPTTAEKVHPWTMVATWRGNGQGRQRRAVQQHPRRQRKQDPGAEDECAMKNRRGDKLRSIACDRGVGQRNKRKGGDDDVVYANAPQKGNTAQKWNVL
ncbi:hypothetical protein BXZ70DRAFT_908852 [Cristinia sonorae]|uniref:Uncharacterized protein n=1 Tax=Cristinia sonorae TaxID=1940300 RepID=A0A8K0ULR8_9AGAR|nr:hypothetical protein BXZ70DRAFT_908852 [Cristinia sonorae]